MGNMRQNLDRINYSEYNRVLMVLNDLFNVCIAYNYTESIAKKDYKN